MKNKIIKAMLLCMSASMALPNVSAFAAEGEAEPSAVEEVNTQVSGVTDTSLPENTESNDATSETNPGKIHKDAPAEETAEEPEMTPEEAAVPEEVKGSYATDDEAKAADTPADFKERLSTIAITSDIFGKYADSLTEFLHGDSVDKASLYNCEISIADKAAELASDAGPDVVNAMKYNIALIFESTYGENAFNTGREVRKLIVSDKDAEFDACTTIKEIDAVYREAGGITSTPAELLNAQGQPDNNDSENSASLSSHVQNIDDVEVIVGSDIPLPQVTYDSEYVASVSIDTSKVNKDVVGVYSIFYIISGVDGTAETVEKRCSVIENSSVNDLRIKMCMKADEIAANKFTEASFKEMWTQELEAAKAEISKMNTEEEMQGVLDKLTETANALLSEQQLFIAKQGYLSVFKDYCAEFEYETTTQKEMADRVLQETNAKIESAATIDEAFRALEEGKAKIQDIFNQGEASIDSLKKEAKAEIDATKNTIQDSTTITENVYKALINRLDACTTVKDIESVTNSANYIFTDIKAVLAGDITMMTNLYRDMKGIAVDSDTTATINLVMGLGDTTDLTDGERRIHDICTALSCTAEEFENYLSGLAGETVEGTTKTELYAEFIRLTGGTVDEELAKAKDDAKNSIEDALNAINTKDKVILAKKEKLKEETFALIDKAVNADELKSVVETAQQNIQKLAKEAEESDKLNGVKETAKKQIQAIVNAQDNEQLKEALNKLAQSVMKAIDTATTEDAINSQLESFKQGADKIIETFKQDAVLAEAKAEMLKKLAELESGINKEYETEDMKNIISSAKNDIDTAKTVEECSKIYNQAKQNYNKTYISAMRTAFAAKIDGLLKDKNFKDETCKKKANDIVAQQKANLKQATNEQSMDNCYQLAKKNIDLITAKDNAIAQLKAENPNLSANASKLLEGYINKINDASSQEDVSKIVKECKDAIANYNQASGDIVKAREEAVSALTNMYTDLNNNPAISAENKAEAKKILDTYIEKINAATSVEEINQIREEGVAALKKYGGDPNKAVPNAATSTTANGAGTPGASDKVGEMLSSGKVKTGDENMGVIAMAGASIITAIAAAALAIRRFMKKD